MWVHTRVDKLKELNFVTEDEPHPIYVNTMLMPKEKEEYFKLLLEYKDVFAWSYKEMVGLDRKIAVYKLSIKKGVSLKGSLNEHFQPKLILKIEKEVNKFVDVGFIHEIKYPT